MHWQDERRRDIRPPWTALSLVIERGDLPHGAPVFRTRVAGRKYLRLEWTSDGEPALWARLEPWGRGFTWLKAERFDSPLAPLRAGDAREAPARSKDPAAWYAFWSRRFATALIASPRSPLHIGAWQLTPCAVRSDAPTHRPMRASDSGLPCVFGVADALDQPASGYESWMLNGSRALFTLRRPSPVSSARVKAWRKSVRDNSLPPVLIGLITGLDAFVVLDGHDRLHAAIAEGSLPPVIALSHVRSEQFAIDETRAASVTRAAWRAIDSPNRRAGTLDRVNAAVVAAYDDTPTLLERTRAWPLEGGVARWQAEVRARAERLGETELAARLGV